MGWMVWMVIRGHRSSKSTSGADNYYRQVGLSSLFYQSNFLRLPGQFVISFGLMPILIHPCPGRLLLWKTQSVVAPPFFYVLVGERGKLKTLKDFLFPKVNSSVHPNFQQMSQVI